MPWALLWQYRKDIGYCLVFLALILSFLYYRHTLIVEGENNIKAQDKVLVDQRSAAIAAQKAKDEIILKDAKDAHDREIQLIRDTATRPLPPIVLRYQTSASSLPSSEGISKSGGPGSENVPEVQGRDSGVRTEQGPDISGLLDALARRADRLSADARELNAVTHP